MRKFSSSELRKRVDEVLYYIWDPIDVSQEPYARYEYESYVSGVLQTLIDNSDIQKISEHLTAIINNSMEITPNREKCNYTAKILLEHKETIEEGCA